VIATFGLPHVACRRAQILLCDKNPPTKLTQTTTTGTKEEVEEVEEGEEEEEEEEAVTQPFTRQQFPCCLC